MRERSPRSVGFLLGPNEPCPAGVVNPGGRSRVLLLGDHAGRAIPERLGTLGLAMSDLDRHIAWDIGTQPLGEALAARLDAAFVHQRYSRLVVDCNRATDREDAMSARSDGTAIPANAGLSEAERAVRVAAIHAPYHAAIAAEIARRNAEAPVVLVSLHSFTPRLGQGPDRPWHVGILHDGHGNGFARSLLAALRRRPDIVVGDNEPYRMDATDHTIPRHAFPARLPYAEIEIRQDQLAYGEGIERWASMLVDAIEASTASL